MATVTVVTADKSAEIEDATIVGASINSTTTRVTLSKKDGSTLDGGITSNIRFHDGSSYSTVESSRVFVGPTDPGTVPDGCIWFDTSS
ncbi:hypothetical protein SEA_MADAMATO_20 [Streptomyces phage Madamato]|nr:hypothetical protein SEA_MADAMATO_20 [Streptomyces phage Madamato]